MSWKQIQETKQGQRESFHDQYQQGNDPKNGKDPNNDVYKNLTPQFRMIFSKLFMEQNNFENRLDRSIMKSFFLNTFNQDLMVFINKFNIDKTTLGPWFTA